MTARKRKSLADWARQLGGEHLPAFGQTAKLLTQARARERSINELAGFILQDVSMTTRVLRLANSVLFNRSGQRISTVSRAVVVLGFDEVRDMALSIAVLDTFRRQRHGARIGQEMARSLHAANQAADLVSLLQGRHNEEVFIATLLYRIGRLAFWCFGEKVDAQAVGELMRCLDERGETPTAIEREILGFTIDELTQELVREWHISPTLTQMLDARTEPRAHERVITASHELVRAMEYGLGNARSQELIAELADVLEREPEDVEQRVRGNANTTVTMMRELGAEDLVVQIPDPEQGLDAAEEEKPWIEPDTEVQMAILQDLSAISAEHKPEIGLTLKMVLEGLYRGAGIDRAVFAMRKPDTSELQGKYGLGVDTEWLTESFVFDLRRRECESLERLLSAGQSLVCADGRAVRDAGLTKSLGRFGSCGLVCAPIKLRGKVLGCLYGDRTPSQRTIDGPTRAAFELFVQQARLALAYLESNESKG